MAEVYVQREVDAFVAEHAEVQALQDEAAQYLPGGSSRGTAYFAPYRLSSITRRGTTSMMSMATATSTS